jgi:hypothetical protein
VKRYRRRPRPSWRIVTAFVIAMGGAALAFALAKAGR